MSAKIPFDNCCNCRLKKENLRVTNPDTWLCEDCFNGWKDEWWPGAEFSSLPVRTEYEPITVTVIDRQTGEKHITVYTEKSKDQ